jgi:hypothetical protein
MQPDHGAREPAQEYEPDDETLEVQHALAPTATQQTFCTSRSRPGQAGLVNQLLAGRRPSLVSRIHDRSATPTDM